MGKATGKKVTWIETADRGTDYYGNCDICKKHMTIAYKLMSGNEYVRENGELYDNAFAHIYGHKECLEKICKEKEIELTC